MESVAPAATFHDTTCLFIDNLHFAIHDDVVVILHKHGVCLQQLLDGVYTLSLESIILHEGILLGESVVFVFKLLVLQL